MDKNLFLHIADLIINNIEGGYYHPNYKELKPSTFEKMGISGETMYGLDRKNGAGSAVTNSDAGKKFWQIIDKEFAAAKNDTKYWNDKADGKKYIAASVGRQLRPLADEITLANYNRYAGLYLSDTARKRIEQSPKLMLQFAYLTWNGPGHFQKCATRVQNCIAAGKTVNEIYQNLQQYRRGLSNSLFAKGADKLDALLPQIESYSGGGNGLLWFLGGALLLGGIYFFVGGKKKKRK